MIQADGQPNHVRFAGRHQEPQRRVVQRPHRSFPIVLVVVEFLEIAAGSLAHAPASGQPAVWPVGQHHIAAIEALPDELPLVPFAIQGPDRAREPVVAVTGLPQELRHLGVAGMDVDKTGGVELRAWELALEVLPSERHVADHRLGLVERVVVVGDRSGGDSNPALLGELFQFGQDLRLQFGRAVNALELDVDEPLEVLVGTHDLDRALVDQRRALPVPRLRCEPRKVIVAVRDQENLGPFDFLPDLLVGGRFGIAELGSRLRCGAGKSEHSEEVATVYWHGLVLLEVRQVVSDFEPRGGPVPRNQCVPQLLG